MRKLILSFLIILILSSFSYAASTTAAFLDMNTNARAAALGNSFTALADDTSAIYFNSAGLTRIKGWEISFTPYKAYEADYISGQIAFPLLGFNVGLGYLGCTVGDIKQTSLKTGSQDRYTAVGAFNYQGQSFSVSLAKEIFPNLSVGTTVKMIQETMIYSGTGFAADFGVLYSPSDMISLGLNAQNALSLAETWNTPDKTKETFPINLRGGLCLSTKDKALNFTTDLSYKFRQIASYSNLKVRSGIEYWVVPFLALRVGLTPPINSPMSQILNSAGVGLRLNNQLFVDCSWTNQDSDLDIEKIEDIYRFSVSLFFETPIPPKKEVTINQPAFANNKIASAESQANSDSTQNNAAIIAPLESSIVINENINLPTNFRYEIIKGKPGSSYILDMYVKDAFGKTVKTLVKEKNTYAGSYEGYWDGTTDNGEKIKAGTYYVRLYATSNEEITSSYAKITVQ
ncbi:MAG: PorV/PorQ family protein [Candidatus Margulisiibacteriota bacterium]